MRQLANQIIKQNRQYMMRISKRRNANGPRRCKRRFRSSDLHTAAAICKYRRVRVSASPVLACILKAMLSTSSEHSHSNRNLEKSLFWKLSRYLVFMVKTKIKIVHERIRNSSIKNILSMFYLPISIQLCKNGQTVQTLYKIS